MKSSATRNTVIGLVLAMLILAALNYAAFTYIKNLNIATSEAIVESAAMSQRNGELFGQGTDDVATQIDALNSHILGADQSVPFLEHVEAQAEVLGTTFDINSIAIDPPTDDTKNNLTEKLRLNFEAVGTWQTIARLVFFIEHMPYRVTIETADFSRLDNPEPVNGKKMSSAKSSAPQWRLRAEFTVLKQK